MKFLARGTLALRLPKVRVIIASRRSQARCSLSTTTSAKFHVFLFSGIFSYFLNSFLTFLNIVVRSTTHARIVHVSWRNYLVDFVLRHWPSMWRVPYFLMSTRWTRDDWYFATVVLPYVPWGFFSPIGVVRISARPMSPYYILFPQNAVCRGVFAFLVKHASFLEKRMTFLWSAL